jgi:autoinducer 2 (AI-2) kinase
MRAAILDGMFTGKVNAMEAAMQGEVAFTGDAGKAMAIQQMQGDMRRLYTAARSAGRRSGRSRKPRAASCRRAKSSRGATAAGWLDRQTDCRERHPRRHRLDHQGALRDPGDHGDRRQRVRADPGAPNEVWITPSQLFKGDLRPEVLVRIDLDGKSLDEGARSPSSEWSMHTQILKKKPEAKAVIHAHAPYATTLANTGLPFLPISTEAAFFGDIPRVPFIMPGTDALAEAVSDAMKDNWAVCMVNHGLVVAGPQPAARGRHGGDHRALGAADPGLLCGGQGAAGAAREDGRDAAQDGRSRSVRGAVTVEGEGVAAAVVARLSLQTSRSSCRSRRPRW